jgi:hypothetical protein
MDEIEAQASKGAGLRGGVWSIMMASMLFSMNARADNNPTKNYEACVERASSSKGSIIADSIGGRSGMREHIIESCGYRPTSVAPDGKARLIDSDCAKLFKWAEEGACRVDAFASYQQEYVRQLDPRVFESRAYERACEELASTPGAVSRSQFAARACTGPAKTHKHRVRQQ